MGDAVRAPDERVALSAILALLVERTGTPFAAYRPATMERRVRNRMASVGARTFREYLDRLAASETETHALVERLTIKVSRFYRNGPVFDRIREDVLPALARRRAPLRVWSAGCARGEEAYTLAMLLDEAGVDGIVEATDVDPGALRAGAAGVYAAEALAELPATLAARYLEPTGEPTLHRVTDSVRERVRFTFHDVTSAAPPPGDPPFDLVCCRNVLIYLNRDLQETTCGQVRRHLASGGVLCLGEADWPSPSVGASLEVLSARLRLFRAPGEHSR